MTEFNIPALQIEHISKSFNAGKNPKKALSDVRFSIEQGDFFRRLLYNSSSAVFCRTDQDRLRHERFPFLRDGICFVDRGSILKDFSCEKRYRRG